MSELLNSLIENLSNCSNEDLIELLNLVAGELQMRKDLAALENLRSLDQE